MLADAHVDVICWNGSKNGSIEFEHGEERCRRLANPTGTPIVTSALAVTELSSSQAYGASLW